MERHYGRCALCGKEGELTFEHIPPRSAFNSHRTKMYTGDQLLADINRMPFDVQGLQYRNQQKGSGLFSLCQSCNNLTGTWYGDSYRDMAQIIVGAIESWKDPVEAIGIRDVYVGRFIKQVISMFCSVNNYESLNPYRHINQVNQDGISPLLKTICDAQVGLSRATMMFSAYIAIAILVIGVLLSFGVESLNVRIVSIILTVILAGFVFITGRIYKQATASTTNTTPSISDAELQEYLKNKTSVSVPQEIPTSAVAFPESTGNSNNQITETLPASTVQQSIPTDTRVNTYITGYVVHTNEGLNIRREPSVQSDITGRLMPSQEIKIYEQVTNGATTWGRTDNGWVSMDYISTDPDSVGQAFRDQHTDAFDVGYVHADGGLNIRSGPGPSYNQVGRLSNGDCVAIFEYQDVGGTTWGRIDRGWISMDYVSQDAYYSSSALEPDQYIIDTYVGGWVDDYNRDFCITISYNMTDGN